MNHKWVRITPDNMHLFHESIDNSNNYKWIDSSIGNGKSLFIPFKYGKYGTVGEFINLLPKEVNEDMTIHFGFKITRGISNYIVPLGFAGFNYKGKTGAELRLHQAGRDETEAMAMTFWPEWRLTWEMGLYIELNTNYEFDIVCEKEAMKIYCNGILRTSISDFGYQPLTHVRIGSCPYPEVSSDSDYEFYDIFCIKKALKPDPNKPIGAVFHPEYWYHHNMYDDFGIKII